MRRCILKMMCFVVAGLAVSACGGSEKFVDAGDYLLGTRIRLRVVETPGRDARADLKALLEMIRGFQSAVDVRKPDGLVGRLNSTGHLVPGNGADARMLVALVELSMSVARASDGAFDPLLGRLAGLWAFSEPVKRTLPPTAAEIEGARQAGGYTKLVRNAPEAIVLSGGAWVDLGGIAKGYMLDIAARWLKERGYTKAVLDFGGNLRVLGARISDGGPEGDWRVAIQHPRRGNAFWGTVRVRDAAVLTSGDYERYFESAGRRYHHIIDAQSGYPATNSVSATVVGPDAGLADALSTALFVLGPGPGRKLLEREYPRYQALWVVASNGKLQEVMSPGFRQATGWQPADGRD